MLNSDDDVDELLAFPFRLVVKYVGGTFGFSLTFSYCFCFVVFKLFMKCCWRISASCLLWFFGPIFARETGGSEKDSIARMLSACLSSAIEKHAFHVTHCIRN